jgi:hypothetical protein
MFDSLNPGGDIVSQSDGTVLVRGEAGRSSPHPLGNIVKLGGPLSLDRQFSPGNFVKAPYFNG